MPADGIILTTVFVILTWIGSLIVFKTSTVKDIEMLREKEKEIAIGVKNNAATLVSKTDCESRRKDFSQDLTEIKSTVIRLETKFDDYMLNGRK